MEVVPEVGDTEAETLIVVLEFVTVTGESTSSIVEPFIRQSGVYEPADVYVHFVVAPTVVEVHVPLVSQRVSSLVTVPVVAHVRVV